MSRSYKNQIRRFHHRRQFRARGLERRREVGQLAVRHAVAAKKQSGSVTINRKAGKKYAPNYGLVELRLVSKETRHMPDKFIHKNANDVTPAFIAYAKPLVGRLPKIGRFKGVPVKKVK